jgi:hypothetical protein
MPLKLIKELKFIAGGKDLTSQWFFSILKNSVQLFMGKPGIVFAATLLNVKTTTIQIIKVDNFFIYFFNYRKFIGENLKKVFNKNGSARERFLIANL